MAAELPVALGTASTFGVLAGSTVTSTGAVSIDGDLGVFAGSTLTGSPIVFGSTHLGDAAAQQAQIDLTTAYNDAAGRNVAPVTVAGNIGGTTLPPGLYKSTSSLAISSGDLTLDAGGDPSAVWIFQISSTFVTTSGRKVILTGGAQAANVFWQVGTSATLGSGSFVSGTIMADQSITLVTGAILDGRALARIGAVTLDGNSIRAPGGTNVVINAPTNGVTNAACQSIEYDFDGDLQADLAVFDPATGNWYIQESAGGNQRVQNWGTSDMIPVAADYDGDATTDIAVYDPSSGIWYILRSSDSQMEQKQWGWSQGYPVPADYDGDGKADVAVYHLAAGDWYIRRSSDSAVVQRNWGWIGARPVPGDYDGDGDVDLAVYNRTAGDWYILQSGNAQLRLQNWGWVDAGAIPSYRDGGIQGLVILAFGDSITYGTSSSSDGPETGYPMLLEKKSEPALGGHFVTINAGDPGEQTSEGVLRIGVWLYYFKPDLSFIMEGTNDEFFKVPYNTTEANLRSMVSQAKANGSAVIIGTIPPVIKTAERDRTAQEQLIEGFNPRIYSIGSSMG
ncbi:MAG TPA: ice-binding family protein, partial [Kiritimatiellia bacterium]